MTYLAKPLAFPDLHAWSDLFEPGAGDDAARAPRPHVVVLHGLDPKPARVEIGPYCSVDEPAGYRSLYVRLRPERLAFLTGPDYRGILGIEHERMHFQVVVRGPSEALVILSHGVILGSHWLALIDPASVPGRPVLAVDDVRARLASRGPDPCDPGSACPGWAIMDTDHGTAIERCDSCTARLHLVDDDVAQLPEAQAALAAEDPLCTCGARLSEHDADEPHTTGEHAAAACAGYREASHA